MQDVLKKVYEWFANGTAEREIASGLCATRDVFQGRLDSFYRDVSAKTRDEGGSALLSAVVGEIGNNAFDHNLGQWQDTPGCFFHFSWAGSWVQVILADRGQGIWSSLKRVMPSLKSDQQALETAFQKRISGRSPEQRGNGLKFVRSVVNENRGRGLLCVSGQGTVNFGGLGQEAVKIWDADLKDKRGKGVFVAILWDHKS